VVTRRGSGSLQYRQFGLSVRADNASHPALLKRLFGGSISNKTSGRAKNWVEWRVFGEAALDALKQLSPFLLVRRDTLKPYLNGGLQMSGPVEKPRTARA